MPGGWALALGSADGASLGAGGDAEGAGATDGVLLPEGVAAESALGATEALGAEQAASANVRKPAMSARTSLRIPSPCAVQSTTVWLCSLRNWAT